MNKLLSNGDLSGIRQDLSKVTQYYDIHKDAFNGSLGMTGISEAAAKAAWSVYVAHHLSDYGNGPKSLEINTLLAAKTIMCSQYSTVALHLFKQFGISDTLLSVIGWDDSAIGDHSQLLFNDGTTKLLLDPTVGLVCKDVTLGSIYKNQAPSQHTSFLKDLSLDWYSQKIINALDGGKLDVWDLVYSVPGFNDWETNRGDYYGAHIKLGDDRDVVVGTSVADRIDTGNGNDVIFGLGGSDILIGGKGIDKMYGGGGNDKYYIDDYRDLVSEYINPEVHKDAGGIDKIISLVSYRLPDYVENITLIGQRNTNAIGNNLNNYLYGNSGNNKLVGGGGADRLYGGLGADDLFGGKDGNKDLFVFNRSTESTLSIKDIIHDFEVGIDKIDLRAIDANVATTNNERLVFSGNEAKPYSVWWKDVGPDVYVHANVSGSLNADFSIQLLGLSKVSEGDFYL